MHTDEAESMTPKPCVSIAAVHGNCMSERCNECLPAAPSRSLKDQTEVKLFKRGRVKASHEMFISRLKCFGVLKQAFCHTGWTVASRKAQGRFWHAASFSSQCERDNDCPLFVVQARMLF
jgi:hypothetical protein